jgi:hypothetical protein
MSFDNLKALSAVEGLRVDTERRFSPRPLGRGLLSTWAQAEGAPSKYQQKSVNSSKNFTAFEESKFLNWTECLAHKRNLLSENFTF